MTIGNYTTGRRVRITGGMQEFIGKTGTAEWKEGKSWRVFLDEPVIIPLVGRVTDDLWEPRLLQRIDRRPRK
jgi:hypothetical protein